MDNKNEIFSQKNELIKNIDRFKVTMTLAVQFGYKSYLLIQIYLMMQLKNIDLRK